MKAQLTFGLFILVSVLNLIAVLLDIHSLNLYTKPLLMPLLIFLFYKEADGIITLPRLLLAIALIFSWIGDISLMFVADDPLFFLGGLGAFLIAHLIFVSIFYKTTNDYIKWSFKMSWPYLVYGVLLLGLLSRHADDLTPAVLVYGLCILSMVITAAHRKGLAQDESYRLVFSGAILFVVSDSVLAINKFVADIPLAQVTIMITYISAQYYIVKGVLAHHD